MQNHAKTHSQIMIRRSTRPRNKTINYITHFRYCKVMTGSRNKPGGMASIRHSDAASLGLHAPRLVCGAWPAGVQQGTRRLACRRWVAWSSSSWSSTTTSRAVGSSVGTRKGVGLEVSQRGSPRARENTSHDKTFQDPHIPIARSTANDVCSRHALTFLNCLRPRQCNLLNTHLGRAGGGSEKLRHYSKMIRTRNLPQQCSKIARRNSFGKMLPRRSAEFNQHLPSSVNSAPMLSNSCRVWPGLSETESGGLWSADAWNLLKRFSMEWCSSAFAKSSWRPMRHIVIL